MKKIIVAAALSALVLSACRDEVRGHATPQAAAEFAEIADFIDRASQESEEGDETIGREALAVIQHFRKNADAKYRSPQLQLTMLHIAAVFNRAELVRCLLQDGADPNAAAQFPGIGMNDEDACTPLQLALADMAQEEDAPQAALDTVNALLAGGADIAALGTAAFSPAAAVCALTPYEETALHLLNRGAAYTGGKFPATIPAAAKGWTRVTEFLLAHNVPTAAEDGTTALHALARTPGADAEGYLRCIDMLLQHGADVNATDAAGVTPLFLAAEAALQQNDEETEQSLAAVISHLLKCGADAYTASGENTEYPHFSAFDLLALKPALLQKLRDAGHALPTPPLQIRRGAPLLADVCRVSINPPTAAESEPFFETIAGVLTPTEEMKENELYPEALGHAVSLLCRIDPARAAAAVAAMPLWNSEDDWKVGSSAAAALTEALSAHPELHLPQELLCTTAEKLMLYGGADSAALFIEMLGHTADARERVEHYARDPRLPMQAGAMCALLRLQNLPLPRAGDVAAWMQKNGVAPAAAPDAVRNALLLTSLERLWFGDMPEAEQRELLKLMREVGAPRAAAAYAEIVKHLNDPEKLDALTGEDDDWKFELEIATARYILSHSQVFHSVAPAAAQH